MSNQVEQVYRLEMLVFTKDQRINELEAELAALKTLAKLPPDYCLSCGGDGGHLEGCRGTTGLMSVLTELNEANARISCLTIANKKLHKELAALKTPPMCPKCGSGWVKIVTTADLFWSACDNPKCHNMGDTFQTIDAALNAWRKV